MPENIRINLLIVALAIPIVNALATVFTPYFPSGALSPGTLRALALVGFLFFFLLTRLEWNLPNSLILLFLAYYLALTFTQSSDAFGVLYYYFRIFIWAMLFPVGYYFFTTIDSLRQLCLSYLFVLVIFNIELVLANVFGYGVINYAEDTVSYGAAGVNITKQMALILLMTPLFFRLLKGKWVGNLLIASFFLSSVFVLLGLKRSALGSIIIGFFIYLFLTPERGRAIRVTVGIGILILSASPFYVDMLIERYEARRDAIAVVTERNIEDEGRFDKDILPAIELWMDGDLRHKLFGSEIFRPELVAAGRTMHVDYARNLVGTGLIGLILFFAIHIGIALEAMKYFRVCSNQLIAREVFAVFWALMAAIVIMGIAGTMWGIGNRAILFLFWGALVGVLRGLALEKIRTGSGDMSSFHGSEHELQDLRR